MLTSWFDLNNVIFRHPLGACKQVVRPHTSGTILLTPAMTETKLYVCVSSSVNDQTSTFFMCSYNIISNTQKLHYLSADAFDKPLHNL